MLCSTRHISLWVLGLGVALNMPIGTSLAQTSKRKSEQQAEALDVTEAKKNLQSGQESRVIGALEQLKQAPTLGKPLAPDVEQLLTKGTTLKITLSALTVLGALGEPSSSGVIAPYVRHRSGPVRLVAANALLKTKGRDAVEALRAALRSSDAEVRDIAARGLGDLKAKEVTPDLFQALDQRVFAAAVSIGKLCDAAECMKFMGQLKKLQLEVITSGTDHLLFRPA
ncbi:MAG TPA: HEAT repeat domain-containing protein, partial [Polyangiaceae bacterium]|nr:HEAT repeat domain-containing protein [Polyangiaceae bacterium]